MLLQARAGYESTTQLDRMDSDSNKNELTRIPTSPLPTSPRAVSLSKSPRLSSSFIPISRSPLSFSSGPAFAHSLPRASSNPAYSPYAKPSRRLSFVGSYENNLLYQCSTQSTSTSLEFTAKIGVTGKKHSTAPLACPAQIVISFSANFYKEMSSEGGNRPYAGAISLDSYYHTPSLLPDSIGYQIPKIGTVQVLIKNQTNLPTTSTSLKIFLIPYNLSDLAIGARTFLNQKTYSAKDGKLLAAIHLAFISSAAEGLAGFKQKKLSQKYYLTSSIRVVFSLNKNDEPVRVVVETPEDVIMQKGKSLDSIDTLRPRVELPSARMSLLSITKPDATME